MKPTKIKRFRVGVPVEDALLDPPLRDPGFMGEKKSVDKTSQELHEGSISRNSLEKNIAGNRSDQKINFLDYTGLNKYDR